MNRRLLLISVMSNALLLIALIWLVPWGNLVERSGVGSLGPGTVRSIKAELDYTNLAVDTKKRLILAYLLRSDTVQPEEYWRPISVRDAQVRIAAIEASVNARSVLSELFGRAAAFDPLFAPAFRPLQSSFGVLSPEKQIAIQEATLASLKQRLSPETATSVAPSGAEKIRSLLTADEYFEYELRESPLAKTLSNRGFAFTEPEFRKTFLAMRQTAGSHASSGAGPARGLAGSVPDETLRGVLGETRFAQFQRTRDPIFGAIQATGHKYELAHQAMERIYVVISRYWQSEKRGVERSAAVWHGLSAEHRKEIDDLMGKDGARELFQLLETYGAAFSPGNRPIRAMSAQDMP